MQKSITIITVCFNAEKEIEKTIQSILKQTNINFEYLIVDGLSKDNTINIANQYKDKFWEKGIEYSIISEKDNGIYNAMNKGVKLAKGEWLLFLNAGDCLYNERVIENIQVYLDNDSEIMYGNTIYELDTNSHLQKIEIAKKLDQIKNGMVFCHQSAFIKKKLLEEFPYDESFKIAADYNFFCGSYVNNKKFLYVNEIISIFQLGGASSNPVDHIEEDERVRFNWGYYTENEYEYYKKKAKTNKKIYIIREKMKKLIPKKLYILIQEYKYKKLGYK